MVNMIKEEIQIMEVEDDQPLMFNLVPPEVLLDVFSFTSGIKLSQLKTVHQQFKKLIENYSKTLPDMTVQQLDVVMDRDKYLKGIVLRKDANVSMHFGRVNDFLDFIRGHPMPIKTLVLWNSIWISKFMFYLNDLVPIGEMQLRHNPDSRFHFNTQRGQISFHGCIRPILPLSVDVLMDDYLRYYKTTKNDRRLCHPSPADEPTGGASHLVPPSNFECAVIRMDNEADRLCIGHEDIVDWALDSDYCVPEGDGGGHVLVMEHLNLDVFLPQFIERMIEDIPQRPWPIRPFTLLFKNVPHTRRGRPPFQGPVRQQFPQLGSQFLAGDLHFDEQTQIHTLTATEDNAEAEAMMVDLEELGPLVPDRLTGGGEQFAFVALYRIGGGSCANGEQKHSTAMEQNNSSEYEYFSSEEQKYSDEQKPSTSAK